MTWLFYNWILLQEILLFHAQSVCCHGELDMRLGGCCRACDLGMST